MSTQALAKLWNVFATTLLVLSTLFTMRSAGGRPSGDGGLGLLSFEPNTIAALALPVDLLLLTVVLSLTLVWCSVGGTSWAHRLPMFYFDRQDIDPSSLGGRLYQAVVGFLTLVVPLGMTVQMADRFFSAEVHLACKCETPKTIGTWDASTTTLTLETKASCNESLVGSRNVHFDVAKLRDERARKHRLLRFGACDGPEYLAGSGWVYGSWGLLVLGLWIWTVWRILFARVET